jgi:hypothetical protein
MPEIFNAIIVPLMQSENSIVKDPIGNVVFISDKLCEQEQELIDPYDPVARIIEAPAYMIEVSGREMYYIRAVDWDNIMMVEAMLENGKWVAESCVRNPPRQMITGIIKKGKLITKW